MRSPNLALLALAFTPLAGLRAAETPKPARPNIILILVDDLGYADLGVHGCKDIPTPHIDKLAGGGVRFSNAYAAGSFCTPTRAALMSGRYQQRTGNEDLTNVTGPLPKAVVTLPERLRAAGYSTGMVGKWHLGEAAGFRPNDRGFDEFFGFLGGGHSYLPAADAKGAYAAPILRNTQPVQEARYLTDAFGEEAVAFLARRQKDKPFFLYLAFNAVHTPIQATDKYLQRFAGIEDRTRRTYAAMLSAVDDAVGAVVAKLAETGQLDRTLVLFSSDNGGPTTRNGVNGSRNAPLRGSKCESFEGGIRVPLLAHWPGALKPGTVYRQQVITMDLTATALALAGTSAEGVEGVNLLPYLRGEKAGAPHDALFWRCRTRSNNYGARQGDWKFVHSTEGAEQPGPKQKPARDMLFNLAEDVGEQHDLAAKHTEKLAALKKLYQEWSDGVDADCRKLGIEPKPAATAAPKKAPAVPKKP